MTALAAFWSRVDTSAGIYACWPWLGATNKKGYGRLRWRGRDAKAHRVALEIKLGRPVTSGLYACHTCDNSPCVNPAHLFEATSSENARDMVAKGRQRRRGTHCRRGHEMTGDNVLWINTTRRYCRTCRHKRERPGWTLAGGRRPTWRKPRASDRAPRSVADLFPDSALGVRERGVPGQRSSTAPGTRARRLRAVEASHGVLAITTAGRATG